MNINNFPKAKKILIEYFVKDVKERNNKAEYKMFKEDDEETISFMGEYFLEVTLKKNPRGLFDVFDDNNLSINIIRTCNSIEQWDWEIMQGTVENGLVHKSRKEAELAAIEEAIKLLENEN